MKKTVFRQYIFVKLFAVFLTIVLVLFGIGISIYNWGISSIREEIIAGACIQNKNFSDQLTREFKRIVTLQYSLVDNWDLMRLSTPLYDNYNAYDHSYMVLRIEEKLNAIKTSSRIVDEIRVAMPYIDKEIRTSDVSKISDESVWLIDNYHKSENKQFLYHNGNMLLISEYPQMYYTSSLDPYYIIYATISKESLLDMSKEMNFYKKCKSFAISKSRDMLISDQEENDIPNQISAEIVKNPGVPVKSGDVTVADTYVCYPVINNEKQIVIYTETGLHDIVLIQYMSERTAFSSMAAYRTILWFFTIAAAVMILLFSRSLYTTIHAPLKKLMHGLKKVRDADFTVTIQDKRTDEFKYIYSSFNDMVAELNNLIEQVYKQKLLVETSKLKQLQAQINPHFLYNSFIILSNRIAEGDNKFATEFCREIGAYFLFVARNKADFVSLKYEIEHAVTYSKIQHARFYNRLTIEFCPLPERFEQIVVPRLILQPILENAFEHTIENMLDNAFLHMEYCEGEGYLDVIIEDNGPNLEDERIEEMRQTLNRSDVEITGMLNIHQRLKIMDAKIGGLLLDRSKYGGLKVSVRIPSETKTD